MTTTKARMWISGLELSIQGLAEQEFRGGSRYRRTDFPWEVAEEHKQKMGSLLEENGFDVTQPIWAQEKVDGDGFLLTQERQELSPFLT